MTDYEDNNPPDIELKDVRKMLNKVIPHLKLSDIAFLYHGSYNVFEVMDKFIFRIPDEHLRNEIGVNMIKREVKVLNFIRKYVGVEIPNPIYVSTTNGDFFMGYEKIEGVSLSRCIDAASQEQKLKIAQEIGLFLDHLHSPKLASIFQSSFPNSMEEYRKSWFKWFSEIKKGVYPILTVNQKDWVSNLLQAFLNNENNFNFFPCVVHCDFDTSNILVDPLTYEIKGIIDFEECKLYDPAIDLLFFDEGVEFMKEIFHVYSYSDYTSIEKRMKFFYNIMGLHYLKFGSENNIPKMIETGISVLINRMK
jgi:aminoglycoside phosphotransferase (APT) family kinase protein